MMFGAVILAGRLADLQGAVEEPSAQGKAGGGGVGRAPRRRALRPKQASQPPQPSSSSQGQKGGSVRVSSVRDVQQTQISYARKPEGEE